MSNGNGTSGVALPLFDFNSTVVPDIDFCEKDASVIESEVITNYEQYFFLATQISKTLGRGDPVRLFLLSIIYQIVVQRSIVDSTGKENLLKYSHGADLDNLGARWGPTRGVRLQAQKSLTTLRFTLANGLTLTTNSTIPLGTLAQSSTGIQFQTTVEGIIQAGTTYVDLPAEAVVSGAIANGLVAGQINQLVSWSSPFLVSVANTTTTSAGSDVETDDHYRARIWMAPESLSTAGPREGYEYWAASANPDIMDVSVYSGPEVAGKVYVYPLMTGGVLPSTDVCNEVYAACNADKIRPLTDQVFVQPPITHNYTPNVTYWIKSSDSQFSNDIQAAVQNAYSQYILWQRSKVGRDINPSQCDQMLVSAGAKRTNIPGSTTFTYVVLDAKTLATETSSVLTYGGLEDQ
jgi:phage-related baseplate assembly protein